MAEIKIEKKSNYWPWILLAILLIGALIYFFGFRNDDDETDVVATTAIETPDAAPVGNGSVNTYVEFVNSGQTMDLDHTYTNGAFTMLIAAIQEKASEIDYDITADIDKVKEHAERITQDPFETTHANSIRSAAETLATSMQKMQQAKFPQIQNQSEEVMSAAKNINPKVLTLDQRDAVKTFFSKSAQLLQSMNQ